MPTRSSAVPSVAVMDAPLRVLVVTESFVPQINGVTGSVCRVLEHLAARGHEARVWAPTGPPTYAGFPVHRVRGARLPFYRDFRLGCERGPTLARRLEGWRPDVVHLASPAVLGLRAARVARAAGIPTVGIYQTDLVGFARRYRVPGGEPAMEHLTRRVHESVDRTLVPSRASLDQLTALGIPDLHLWPRGVDTVLFAPERRSAEVRARWADPDEHLVGFVGRLAAEKELPLLRELSERPGVRLLVVGDGPERARLTRALPAARFAGVLRGEELAATVASLDVMVHPGRHETFCQSAQEGLASGVPVVAVDAGGPRDLVVHGVSGLLVPPGDGPALAAAVTDLLARPVVRQAMAVRARRSVRQRSWAAVNDRLIAHYTDLVTGGARPDADRRSPRDDARQAG